MTSLKAILPVHLVHRLPSNPTERPLLLLLALWRSQESDSVDLISSVASSSLSLLLDLSSTILTSHSLTHSTLPILFFLIATSPLTHRQFSQLFFACFIAFCKRRHKHQMNHSYILSSRAFFVK